MGRVRCAASPAPGAAGAQSGQPWALPKENRRIRSISSVPLRYSGLTGVVVLYFAGSDQVARDSTLGCLSGQLVPPPARLLRVRDYSRPRRSPPLRLRCRASLPFLLSSLFSSPSLTLVFRRFSWRCECSLNEN